MTTRFDFDADFEALRLRFRADALMHYEQPTADNKKFVADMASTLTLLLRFDGGKATIYQHIRATSKYYEPTDLPLEELESCYTVTMAARPAGDAAQCLGALAAAMQADPARAKAGWDAYFVEEVFPSPFGTHKHANVTFFAGERGLLEEMDVTEDVHSPDGTDRQIKLEVKMRPSVGAPDASKFDVPDWSCVDMGLTPWLQQKAFEPLLECIALEEPLERSGASLGPRLLGYVVV